VETSQKFQAVCEAYLIQEPSKGFRVRSVRLQDIFKCPAGYLGFDHGIQLATDLFRVGDFEHRH